MYLVDKNAEFTTEILGNILKQFQTKELVEYIKLRKYYDGKQAILLKQATDVGKPANKVVTNFCKYIVDTYAGYLAGKPITYENDDFEEVIDILKWNDVVNEDNSLLKNALIYGKAFEINYVDELGNQRFKLLDTRSCIDVYDNTLNNDLQYVVRFWEEELDANNQPRYMVEVYGPATIKRYRSGAGFMSFTFLEEVPHFYGQCPVTVFSLNTEEKGIFSSIITLQDSYNDVLSGSVDDFDSFADAYLILKGMQADEDDLKTMKTNRVLMMDADCDASYLTKDINDVQTLNLLKNFRDNIHKISNCPDFTDENFMSQSGIAIRYKLTGMETTAANIESYMRKALQRRIELIAAILNLTSEERLWRDATITFTRNLPIDLSDTVDLVNKLRGVVSERTLLSLLPFVSNVDEEIEQLAKEKEANMALYSFNREDNGLLEE